MAVIKRDIQLWAIWSGEQLEAVVLTEIIDYPRKRYCNVHGLAGVNHKRWLHLVWNIEEWAKTKGCDGIESAHGRVGFERELKELGWKSAARYFEKEF